MTIRISRFLKRAVNSRTVYVLVVLNLCFVAYEIGSSPFASHGLASCVAIGEGVVEFDICSNPLPPPLWTRVGFVLNLPTILPVLALSKALESEFPQLCGYMSLVNMLTVAVCVCLQWMVVGYGIERIGRKLKGAGNI